MIYLANILQLLKLPDGTVKVLVEGLERAEISDFVKSDTFFEVKTYPLLETKDDNNEVNALIRTSVRQFEQYIKLNRKIPPEVLVNVNQISEANKLADTISAHLNLKISEKQRLLETTSVKSRLEKVINLIIGDKYKYVVYNNNNIF